MDRAVDEPLVASPLVLRFSAVMGVPAEELLLACGLSGVSALTHADGMRLWSKLEELTGDPYVGLSAGGRVSLDFMGMMGLAFASAVDLAAGLRLLERTIPLLIRNAPFTLAFERDRGGVIYEAPSSDVRHGVDSMLAAILHLARSCTAHRLTPTAVALQSAPPIKVDRYRELFGVDPAFGAKSSALWFSSDDLARPFRGADPATASVLLAHAPALLMPPAQAPSSSASRGRSDTHSTPGTARSVTSRRGSAPAFARCSVASPPTTRPTRPCDAARWSRSSTAGSAARCRSSRSRSVQATAPAAPSSAPSCSGEARLLPPYARACARRTTSDADRPRPSAVLEPGRRRAVATRMIAAQEPVAQAMRR